MAPPAKSSGVPDRILKKAGHLSLFLWVDSEPLLSTWYLYMVCPAESYMVAPNFQKYKNRSCSNFLLPKRVILEMSPPLSVGEIVPQAGRIPCESELHKSIHTGGAGPCGTSLDTSCPSVYIFFVNPEPCIRMSSSPWGCIDSSLLSSFLLFIILSFTC